MLFHSHCLCTSEQYLLRPSLVSVLRRRATTLSDIDYSTTKSPDSQFYPFPKTHRPTPYEIFHLPIGASSADVKSRYYELVRQHHPDSPCARTHTSCPLERNTRFQAILSAYNVLQNPSRRINGHYSTGPGFDPYMAEIHRRHRTSQNAQHLKQRRQAMKDEQWQRERDEWAKSVGGPREWLMVGLGVIALLGGLYPSFFLFPFRLERTHRDALANLTKARSDAQEIGHLRRGEVRKRVQNMKTPVTDAEKSDDKV